jgi:hypothetical protein
MVLELQENAKAKVLAADPPPRPYTTMADTANLLAISFIHYMSVYSVFRGDD